MAKRDYYDILGIAKNADNDAIRNAYRKKAMQYHPDRNAGNSKAEASFKEVGEAYGALKDPEKRAAYDRFGHAAFEAGGGNRAGARHESGFSNSGFSDIFEEMFGDLSGRRTQSTSEKRYQGDDLRYDIRLTIEDCFYGGERRIEITAPILCNDCQGSGAADGAELHSCPQCHGHGVVRVRQGFFTLEQTCGRCQGQGRTLDKPCKGCKGTGQRQGRRVVDIDIPAGIDHGNRIRIAGKGGAGIRGGKSGDLYIFTTIAKHNLFERENNELFCKVPLPATMAMLGGSLLIPAIEGGQTRLKIPAGTQSGQYFKIRRKGMPRLRGGGARGDMIVETYIETPQHLTSEQLNWIKNLDHSLKTNKQLPKTHEFENRVEKLKKR